MPRTSTMMSEEQFQAALVQRARLAGFRVHFIPDKLYRRSFPSKADRESGRASGKWDLDMGDRGFPDLVLVRRGQIAFRELKVGRNTLSENQELWRDDLLAAEQDWALWHGRDYDEILEALGDELLRR